ncbi:hypothetical protein CTI12_AA554620 [Artemisia annua]|uniref:Uncharacterized protein n=1 Tax=Artemisia annua TaxID=35608 RepID=A0A2U1KWW1_ARTAN|nr:hypothetical protein CTI12_AA554620 [Artemisia annua]
MMKLTSATVVASLVAASTAALSSVKDLRGRMDGETCVAKDKFAPRFDGLRFIETLVTAHK